MAQQLRRISSGEWKREGRRFVGMATSLAGTEDDDDRAVKGDARADGHAQIREDPRIARCQMREVDAMRLFGIVVVMLARLANGEPAAVVILAVGQ
jgi:hypothetical protein